MGYQKIENLYKAQDILLFRECYALEKIEGTSAHISWKDHQLRLFAGGGSHHVFCQLFDESKLKETFIKIGHTDVTIYGEFYGGSIQGMRKVYGEKSKFVAFEVCVDHKWLSVPQAKDFVDQFELDFVHYNKIPATLEDFDKERSSPSQQAIKCGMGDNHEREGIILRPLIELTKNNGARIICKYKNDNFRETNTVRKVVDPEMLKILEDADAIAEEWVVMERLKHVLNKMPYDIGMESTKDVIKNMMEDVKVEAMGEIVWSKEVEKAIGKKTAALWKKYHECQIFH